MNKLIIIFFFTITALSQAQSSAEEINNLENNKKLLVDKVGALNDSIKKIAIKINYLKSKEISQQFKDSIIIAVVRKGGKMRQKPQPVETVILTFEQDTNVNILDYYDGYFGVCENNVCGYISDVWIILTDKVRQLKEIKEQEKLNLDKLQLEINTKNNEIEFAKIEKERIKKYGKVVYAKLEKGLIWIGMTDEMALISLGWPKTTNRTVTSYGTREQWVYGSNYYYFENGIMTAYQD